MTTKVTAIGKTKDDKGAVTGENEGVIEFNFGENLEEAVKLYGKDAVFNNYRQASTIALQGNMRRHLSQGKKGKELLAALKDWKPGQVSRQKKSAGEKLQAMLKGMTPEQVAATLKEAGIG
ncbi:MAG: hypothetical protein COA94_04895 [Rickettsiales bacterium]|nr:MAG: hypothetical protein COA94_04895 [Rickettsiales bacterium]